MGENPARTVDTITAYIDILCVDEIFPSNCEEMCKCSTNTLSNSTSE